MNWKALVNDKIRQAFRELCETYPMGPKNFDLDRRDYEYLSLRQKLLEIDGEARAVSEGSPRRAYLYDLEFGLRMYNYLSELGFGLWEAADNGCWAYISIKIVPDIVYNRWGDYNEDRFYKRNWRLWLKALWWYVHITEDSASAKFDIDSTRELLKGNSQDIIYLLLDHVGDGFRDSTYHLLMKRYCEACNANEIGGNHEDFFRSIMLQHQINSTVIDPVLSNEKAYVEALYSRVLPLYKEKRR